MSNLTFAPGLYMGVDCGTGSMRTQVFNVQENGDYELVYNQTAEHNISHDLREYGAIAEETIRQLEMDVKMFLAKGTELGVKGIAGAATESLRAAQNGAEVLARLAEGGLEFQMLSGMDELHTSLFGSIPYLRGLSETFYFADSGGGSTEVGLINSTDFSVVAGESLQVGVSPWSHRLELLGDITPPEHLEDAIAEMTKIFATAMEYWPKPDGGADLVVGGSPMHLLRFHHKVENPEKGAFAGTTLTRTELENIAQEMAAIGLSGRLVHPFIHGKGASFLLPASLKMVALMNATGATTARIVPSGICSGLCLQAAQATNKNLAS